MTDNNPVAEIDDLATWVTAYQEAQRNAAQWSDTADQIKARITEALTNASAEIGTIGGQPAVKWVPVVSRRVDTKAFKTDHPELAEKYTVLSTSRRFTVIGG